MKKILLFGAGKIGRSFIGQLFGNAGYEVVFVDMDESLVNELNRRCSYPVIIKGVEKEERLVIENVRAIHAVDSGAVIRAVRDTDIMAISVGKKAVNVGGAGVFSAARMFRDRIFGDSKKEDDSR